MSAAVDAMVLMWGVRALSRRAGRSDRRDVDIHLLRLA